MMRFYNQQHRFYCGVDLHARTLSLHVLDAHGQTVLARTVAAGPEAFLAAVAPFRDGLAVACECLFAWYWLADLCQEGGDSLRPGPRPVHEGHPRRQGQ